MKSLASIAWNVDEPTYRSDSALSYSTLSRYEREGKFNALPNLFDKLSTPSLTFGSMVDTLITSSEEEYKNQFICVENPGISDTLKEITEKVFALYHEIYNSFDDIPNEILSQVGKSCDFWANDKYDEVRGKKIRENCKPYYNTLLISEGKTVITEEEDALARACVEALRTSPYTSFAFGGNQSEDVEVYYQLKFKGEYEGINYRCMVDAIIVNHTNKTIQPIDLKTSSHNEWEFPLSFQKYRYDLQARLYWRLIKQNLEKDDFFKDYKLLDYKFIVINKKNCKPLVWDFPMTQVSGEISFTTPSGYKVTWRDPYVIGEELHEYLETTPELPKEIGTSNNIMKWLQTH